jgi:hypothetical protein
MLLFSVTLFGTVILTANIRYTNWIWRVCGINPDIADLTICVSDGKSQDKLDLFSDDARQHQNNNKLF